MDFVVAVLVVLLVMVLETDGPTDASTNVAGQLFVHGESSGSARCASTTAVGNGTDTECTALRQQRMGLGAG